MKTILFVIIGITLPALANNVSQCYDIPASNACHEDSATEFTCAYHPPLHLCNP